MTTWPARSGAGLINRSPALRSAFKIGVALTANVEVSRPGPGRPRAIDAYPEQSRRYPPNQVAGSVLDRYGTGPPFHAVNHVAARANTASPAMQPAASASDDLSACGQVLTHCSGLAGIACQLP